jgi:putative ABC transport system substrate-binding protein
MTNRNIEIEYRYTGGRQDKVAPLVAEIVGLDLDLHVAWGPPLARAVKQAAPEIPLVFLIGFDAVDEGLVPNLSRPGGNATGIAALASPEIVAKRLQLLKEAVPSLARVAALFSTERNHSGRAMDVLRASARELRLRLDEIEVEAPSVLEAAMRRAKDQGAQAMYIWPTGFALLFAKQISDIAIANVLPCIHPFKEGAVAGCLLAYASDLKEQARRGAGYVDKILRGAQPGDIPVEQPTKFDLVINLRTAKALGLTVPLTLQASADEVIE